MEQRVTEVLLEKRSHDRLLELVRRCVDTSESYMRSLSHHFDRADENFRSVPVVDKDNKKPTKLIVPVSYAQVITNASLLMEIFLGRKYVFELDAAKPEWTRGAKLMEVLLQYQCNRQHIAVKIYNWLLSALQYGVGVIRTSWVEEKRLIRVREEPQGIGAMVAKLLGRELPKVEVDRELVVYSGNEIDNIPIRDWRPDPRVGSLAKFQDGEFCGSTMRVAWNYLKRREASMNYVGLEKLEESRMSEAIIGRSNVSMLGQNIGKGYVKIDEMWIDLIPADYGLSDIDEPQIWVVVLANNHQIIRAEPSKFPYGKFPYDIIEYSPNESSDYNEGLVGTIAELQELFDWFFNAHVTNVRECIGNRFVYDSFGIESEDLKQGKRYIRLKPQAQGTGVDRWIKQFQVMDVTRGHVADSETIYEIIQRITGVTENLQGMQTQTRRTATEIANIQRAAIGRIKTQAQLMFAQGFAPWGAKLIQNTQAFMTEEVFVKVAGTLPQNLDVNQEGFLAVNPSDIQGLFDIVPLDATMRADKLELANRLSTWFSMIAGNPMLVQAIGVDVKAFSRLLLQLYEVKNVNDIIVPNVQVVSNEQFAQIASNGQRTGVIASPPAPSGIQPPVSGIGEQTQVFNRLAL